jgi:hypothetical protein
MSALAERIRGWELPDLENNWRLIVALPVVFFGSFWIWNRFQLWVCGQVLFDCPLYWPISIFEWREPPNIGYPNRLHLTVALAAFLIFIIATYVLRRVRYRLWLVLVLGTVLILLTNLTHGLYLGFRRPVEGTVVDRREYYNQAELIDSPLEFFRDFNAIQRDLLTHSHTHPPTATLLFYYLGAALGNTVLIAVFITVVGAAVSGIYLNRLFRREFDKEHSGYMVFVFLLTPAVQIYYTATIDALILAVSLAAVVSFIEFDSKWSLVWASIFTLLASSLTFTFLYLLVVFFGYEVWTRRSLRRTTTIVIVVILTYAVIKLISGFDYLESFLLASLLENVSEEVVGWRLLWDTVNYIFTRIENVAEIIFFLGPYLIYLFVLGLVRTRGRPDLMKLALTAMAGIGLMWLTGAYRTGETVRGAFFVYPFLFLPIAYLVSTKDFSRFYTFTLPLLIFLQALVMQLVGNFHW